MIFRFAPLIAGYVLLCANIAGCQTPGNTLKALPKLRPVDKRVSAAYNEFGFDLLRRLHVAKGARNLVLSPLSMGSAFALTMNGAGGSTRTALSKVLHASQLSLTEINAGDRVLRSAQDGTDAKIKLSIANGLWANREFPFAPKYFHLASNIFEARAESLDFNDGQTPPKINDWVRQKTSGQISEVVQRIEPRTVMLLLNAVYFDGRWSTEFKPLNTREGTFRRDDGSTKLVAFMHRRDEFSYFKAADSALVALPYGQGRVKMYFVLPDKGVPLRKVLLSLNNANWNCWSSQMKMKPGSITIPKYRIQSDVTLNDVLKSLGAGAAFDKVQANFQPMSAVKLTRDNNLYIGRSQHTAILEVGEKGTIAAAVTKNEFNAAGGSLSDEIPFSFVADRPFLCIIRDDYTGSVLFAAAVYEP